MSNTVTLPVEQFNAIINILTHDQLKLAFLNFVTNGTIEQVATVFIEQPTDAKALPTEEVVVEEVVEVEDKEQKKALVVFPPSPKSLDDYSLDCLTKQEQEIFSKYRGTASNHGITDVFMLDKDDAYPLIEKQDKGRKDTILGYQKRCAVLYKIGYRPNLLDVNCKSTIAPTENIIAGENITCKRLKDSEWSTYDKQIIQMSHKKFADYCKLVDIWVKVKDYDEASKSE